MGGGGGGEREREGGGRERKRDRRTNRHTDRPSDRQRDTGSERGGWWGGIGSDRDTKTKANAERDRETRMDTHTHWLTDRAPTDKQGADSLNNGVCIYHSIVVIWSVEQESWYSAISQHRISNNLTYYGLILTSSSLAGNRFFNFFLQAAMEFPACVMVYFCLRKFVLQIIIAYTDFLFFLQSDSTEVEIQFKHQWRWWWLKGARGGVFVILNFVGKWNLSP